VLFLEGGGACYTEVDCFERAQGDLGSSKLWPATHTDSNNVLSTSTSVNPGFATWNHVYIPYCGGDVHSGQRTDKEWGFAYFAGYLTVRQIFNDLNQKYNFTKAKLVLLSGSSAGGIGTLVHADGLTDFLPNSVVKAEPQGGWFFPNVTYYANWSAGTFEPVPDPSTTILWDGYLNPACVKANPSDPYLCNTIDTSYPYIRTPLYIAENKFDSNQIFTQLGCPQNASNTNDYIAYFGKAMQFSVQQVVNSPKKDGLFLMSCLDHTSNTGISSNTVVEGVKQGASVDDWFFNGGTVSHVLVDNCAGDLPCNPTCQ